MSTNTNPPLQIISIRRFSIVDQMQFASFSGDFNPIHVDPIAARRTMSGQCIVHGMNSLLWALDSLANKLNITATELKVKFLKPTFLDEEITCVWNDESSQLSLKSGETILTTISLKIGQVACEDAVLTKVQAPRRKPDQLSFLECSKLCEQPLIIHGDTAEAAQLFPSLCRLYGLATACEIAALSQIVGMECPGLHSLFASLQVQIKPNKDVNPTYGVIQSDGRINLLRISAKGHTVCAELEAFYPPPSSNLTISDLASHVRDNEFENVCALIVGGSRGLGELVAKLIAVGGGNPIITYSVGKIEADRLMEEIHAWGGKCTAFQLTVNNATTIPSDISTFNQLYYFATPKIFGKRSTVFDQNLSEKFLDIYVNGFYSICNSIIGRGQFCTVLYPSTVAIDKPLPELAEYTSAKVEGEKLCEMLNENKLLNILTPRLPRLATDQTQSIIRVDSDDPLEIMLPLLREMLNSTNLNSPQVI